MNNLKENVKLKIAISKAKEKENIAMKENKYSIKKVAMIVGLIVMFSGASIAAPKIIEKIWQNPEKIIVPRDESHIHENISEEYVEKVKAISKDEALEKAKEIFKEFDYDENIITSVEVEDRPQNYTLIYRISHESGALVTVDGRNDKNWSITNLNAGDIEDYRGNREELEKVVRDICKKHNIDLSDRTFVNVKTNTQNEETAWIWFFYFYKDYGEYINKYEEVSVAIVPEINKPLWIIVNEEPVKNKEIIITEEEAKNIALNAEKQVNSGVEIAGVEAKLDIARMNGRAYFRMNDYENYKNIIGQENTSLIYYKTENYVRRCWMVTIGFKEKISSFNNTFTYFVDATTGEIIGGNEVYYRSGITE